MKNQSTDLLPTSLLSTSWKTACNVSSGFVLSYGLLGSSATAQIVVDNTTPTVVNPSVANCAGICITGGLRDGSSSSANIFHSFSEFNIGSTQTVTFDSQSGVNNIFSRVTGRNASTINGTLGVNGNANLFLLNPNGIIFGSKAQLSIPGSLLTSTANSVLFQNGDEFSTTSLATPSLLNINVPTGLQFGSGTPSTIGIQGDGNALSFNRDFTINRGTPSSGLIASEGKTLALIGGDVIVQGGNLASENGHIEVGSIGIDSTVAFTSTASGWDIDYTNTNNFQDISLSQNSSINVSDDDAGSIQLQGRQIDISGGSGIIANVTNSGNGNIAINAAERLSLTGVNLSRAQPIQTVVYVEISPGATGDGNSEVSVNTPELNLAAGAQIGLSMAGSGSSGEVNIAASNIFVDSISNFTPSALFAAVRKVTDASGQLTADGQGGNLNIQGLAERSNRIPVSAEQLSVTNGASISTETNGPGDAGQLNIKAKDIAVLGFTLLPNGDTVPSSLGSASRESVSGNGGETNISTERLVVAEGGQISVSTNSTNAAGNLTIQASESVELRGSTTEGRSGLFALARRSNGAGGNIEVTTDQLSLLEGATINASNFSSTASGAAPGTGPAGNIQVIASDITLQDESIITTDTVEGDRANITLQSNSLSLRRGSSITTNANTRSTSAAGTTVVAGSATGGNINITPQALHALGKSAITANASNSFGGHVVITADLLLGTTFREKPTPDSDITASSDLGTAFSGSVEINSPDIDPTNGLTQLPEGLAPTSQIVAACEQLENNTFVATGRGGLPENASQLITGESIWNDFRLRKEEGDYTAQPNTLTTKENKPPSLSTINSTTESSSIVEAQTWALNNEGEVVLGIYTETTTAPQYQSSCNSSA